MRSISCLKDSPTQKIVNNHLDHGLGKFKFLLDNPNAQKSVLLKGVWQAAQSVLHATID
jgi:hypothetical protein